MHVLLMKRLQFTKHLGYQISLLSNDLIHILKYEKLLQMLCLSNTLGSLMLLKIKNLYDLKSDLIIYVKLNVSFI